jgi:signal transduction histidine kinase
VVDCLAQGAPIWIESRAELTERYPDVAAKTKVANIALAVLPLSIDGGCAGVIAFTFVEPHRFEPEDKLLLEFIAHNGAQAIQRARLFEGELEARGAAEAAHGRSAFLVEASDVLAATLDFRASLADLARMAVPRLCDVCAVVLTLAEGDARGELVAVEASDPAHGAIVERLREGLPREPECRTAPGEFGLASLMLLPLRARGRTFGGVMFGIVAGERRYGEADLELGKLIARRAAIAIDNALLYESAQAAARARDNVLAIVSHDLRNPLGVVLTGAGQLHKLDAGPAGPRLRKYSELMLRAAERMSRLIDDLMDFAAMQSGRLALERRPCGAHEVLSGAAEMFAAAAAERQLELVVEASSDVPPADCDPHRAIQALGNLLSNAVKVTAAGGRIRLGAAARAGAAAEVAFYVEDTGPGIAPEELPRIFERYFRGERTSYRGTGLGLAIAKGIAEAHGGQLRAESQLGVGSRFTLVLPVARTP